MGFGMKKILFITFLAVIIPFIVFGFIGCVKAPKTTIDYGPEISAADVQAAVTDAIVNVAPSAPLSIRTNQYVYIEHSQALDIYNPIIISQRGDTITARTDTDTTFSLGIDIQLNELQSDGTMKFSRSHSDLPNLPKTSPPPSSLTVVSSAITPSSTSSSMPSIQALTTPQLINIQDYSVQSVKAQATAPDPTVTYHNLKKTSGIMPVPDLVKARTDCGGITNCSAGIRFIQLNFDRVVWDSSGNGTKTSIQYIFSPDVPTYVYDWDNSDDLFFTTQLSQCAQQWIAQTSSGTTRYIPVRDCRDLQDFRFGPVTP